MCARSYDEDVVVMIAHLQMLFYFFNNGESSVDKMCRLAFMVLHKLAILSQQVIMVECASLVLIVFGRSFECRHVFYISIVMDQYIHTYTHLMALLP